MATNEWGMLRDIFTEIADENIAIANALPPAINPTAEATKIAHYMTAATFRAVADKMRTRAGMTPDELAAGIAEMFGNRAPRTTDKEQS